MPIKVNIKFIERQKSNRQYTVKLNAIASLMMIAIAPAVMADPSDKTKENTSSSINVVYRLYKDYAWMALGLSARDAKSVFRNDLPDESVETLRVYFDETLTGLLWKDSIRRRSKPGEVGLLDFDPIFASQDASASDLKAVQLDEETVLVSFIYPSNGHKIEIEYSLRKHGADWKIADIRYLNKGRASLKKILSK